MWLELARWVNQFLQTQWRPLSCKALLVALRGCSWAVVSPLALYKHAPQEVYWIIHLLWWSHWLNCAEEHKKFALLIDATIDTLAVGLKERDFTSVDLVNVRYLLFNENQDIQLSLKFVYLNYTLRSMPFCFPLSYLKASLLYNASAVSGHYSTKVAFENLLTSR